MVMKTMTYCDHCGDEFATETMYHFDRLPVAISSANAGESASLCGRCAVLVQVLTTKENHDE